MLNYNQKVLKFHHYYFKCELESRKLSDKQFTSSKRFGELAHAALRYEATAGHHDQNRKILSFNFESESTE